MTENYILTVTGSQTVDDNRDKVELQTSAAYVLKNRSRYITYNEYDAAKPEKVFRTTVKVDPKGIVTVMKGGDYSHHLILEKNKRYKFQYNTPYGALALGIYTEKVKIDLDDQGGEVYVKYTIDADAQLISTNELTLKIKEANHNDNSSKDC